MEFILLINVGIIDRFIILELLAIMGKFTCELKVAKLTLWLNCW